MLRRSQANLLLPLFTAWMTFAVSAHAQLVSVRCCTNDAHLDSAGTCLSGDGNETKPEGCQPAATCVLGFGEGQGVREMLCDPAAAIPPVPFRGYCSTWSAETPIVGDECVAKPEFVTDFFDAFDDDGDGDFDDADVTAIEAVRPTTPKIEQSPASVQEIECCTRSDVYRLSGPGIPQGEDAPSCTVTFTHPVELGDYMFGLCADPPPEDFVGPPQRCTGWSESADGKWFACTSKDYLGETVTGMPDSDADADADLRDVAIIQNANGPYRPPDPDP